MRVLMLHHDPAGVPTGAGHMAQRTAVALEERGHDVVTAGAPPTMAAVAAVAGTVGWVPDVVHVTDLVDTAAATCGLALARACGAVLAVTPATEATLWADQPAALEVVRQADVVFALTPTEGATLVSLGAAPDRVVRLGQGPQLGGVPDPEAFRAGVGARGALVLFLGRKLVTKGHRHLIAAAPAIRACHPDATVVVAGPTPGTDPSPAPALVPGVVSLGALDEVDKHSALVAADLLCLPSTVDAFPLVFVEAWWCGTPVVSGPFPGAGEVVRDGIDGLVVEADATEVAAAVVGLLDAPARLRAMAAAGKERAEAELSWAAVAADAERGYRTCCEGTWRS